MRHFNTKTRTSAVSGTTQLPEQMAVIANHAVLDRYGDPFETAEKEQALTASMSQR